jgi:hypothetical protein
MVLDPSDDQEDVFLRTKCTQLVSKVVEGFHATILAYGQTSSGKTYTMEGYDYVSNEEGVPVPDVKKGANLGITPRCIKLLFDSTRKAQDDDTKYTISCSFLQIYQEKIFDLLNSSLFKAQNIDIPSLKLKWINYETYQVENLFTFEVKSFDECMFLFKEGIKNKIMASH